MSHVRVDVAVERLIVRFGTYGDGLFGKRFLVVSELFQLGDELAVALRATLVRPSTKVVARLVRSGSDC